MEDCLVEMPAELRFDMARECGDILWYLTAIATDLGYSLDEVAMNLEKLEEPPTPGSPERQRRLPVRLVADLEKRPA